MPTAQRSTMVALAVGLGILAVTTASMPPQRSNPEVSLVRTSDTSLSASQLAQTAKHIVVARVVSADAVTMNRSTPRSSFTIDVVATLRGSLPARTQVLQVGGLDSTHQQLVVVEGDRQLRVGDLVLLCLRSDDDELVVIPGAGNRLLDPSLPWEDQPAVVTMRAAIGH